MPSDIAPMNADLPDAVQWSEGMLLSPQHMQQNDIAWHALAARRMAAQRPDYFGLLSLALDERAWGDGWLKIAQLSAILPDGLPVEFPLAEDAREIRLNLNEEKRLTPNGKPLRIWLAIARRGVDAARQDGYLQRYFSLPGELVADENTGADPLPVARLRPNLVLLADEKLLPHYVAMPLMEVQRDADGHLQRSAYVPPMLRLGGGGFLGEYGLHACLEDLSRRVWRKLRELAEQGDDADGGGVQARLARQLAAAMPYFDVTACDPDSHPREAYRALALLVGQAAGLAGAPLPPLMSAYRHEDSAPQFGEGIAFVARRVDAIVSNLERLPFTNAGESGFVRRLDVDAHTDRLLIELKPRAGQTLKDMQSWLAGARVASDDLLPMLRQRRLPGANVRLLDDAERQAMGLSPSATLFVVNNQQIDRGDGLGPVFRAGRPLVIQGAADRSMPAGILLYRWKGAPPWPAAGSAQDGGPLAAARDGEEA
ncbi:MAG: type VI secretion system baseplate subunit TssK [Rhodocyclaceae bacterium]|nr:type VI secretion system baseplate subunit TssK [Rhodocyclaceae bacterium]MBX3668285.1 type VI secretion system baseplate subunit TssK [Rhodocyclaceae bacterium]